MRKGVILIFLLSLVCIGFSRRRYGTGLTASGSSKMINTVFTNPGEDASTMMNISFTTPNGVKAEIELTDEDNKVYKISSEGEPCVTFDSIYSKLGDNSNVYERHVFDKHDVELTNLKPDTYYSYRITVDSAGYTVSSDTYSFLTAGPEYWRAAIIGDFHHYSPLWSRLDAAMEMLNTIDSVTGGYDWILSTGDQCAYGGSFNYWTELSEQPEFKNYMWAVVQGNHDHEDRKKVKSDAYFRDSHTFPFNGYDGQEGVTYWFKYGNALFFMLNNEAMKTSGSISPVFKWMEEVIQNNPAKYLIVVQHNEWLIGTDGSNSQLDRFYKFFDRMGVNLAISGNNHAYLRTFPLSNRQVSTAEEGTYYVVTPSSDNSRGRALKKLKANNDIIAKRWSEGANTVGGMLMDVTPDSIVMTLIDRYGKVQDNFTVKSKE